MPRIRTIKPQFWLDENLGAISRDVRLLYIGLWNLSDDTGVFRWRPLQIKAQIFPYDTDIDGDVIKEWLGKLVEIGDVECIDCGDERFGRISSFLEHQDIKNPSKWQFLNGRKKDGGLPQPYRSPTPALPIGKRKSKKEKYITIGNFTNIKLTQEEFDKLIAKFGQKGTIDKIENLSLYIGSKGDHYKSHYFTILSWDRHDEKDKPTRGKDGW